jgi:hypothetical protein
MAPAGTPSPVAPAPGSPAPGEPGAPPAAGDTIVEDTVVSAGGIRSVYTSLAERDCRVVEKDAETGGTDSRCPGTAGYALMVSDHDARMSVDVVAPGGRTHRLRYPAVISSAFTSLGPRAEWRMRGATPIALIVRVNAFEVPETPNAATSYLAVARLTPAGICVTDRIPPSADANEKARVAADASASRPCLQGPPRPRA